MVLVLIPYSRIRCIVICTNAGMSTSTSTDVAGYIIILTTVIGGTLDRRLEFGCLLDGSLMCGVLTDARTSTVELMMLWRSIDEGLVEQYDGLSFDERRAA